MLKRKELFNKHSVFLHFSSDDIVKYLGGSLPWYLVFKLTSAEYTKFLHENTHDCMYYTHNRFKIILTITCKYMDVRYL